MRIFLATTTINVPSLLQEYAKDALMLTSRGDFSVEFVIAGDRKTPQKTPLLLNDLERRFGIPMHYLNPIEQMGMLKNERALKSFLDFDCIQRRNLAGLYSYRHGADLIVYIDDDNIIQNEGYFEAHLNAMLNTSAISVKNSDGFLNIMKGNYGARAGEWLFPRGFPFNLRNSFSSEVECSFDGKIAANAGLWIEEPDIDAVTRIAARPIVDGYDLNGNSTILYPGTWTPLNSQNSAILATFLPAYYLSSHVGRYDDIYAGFILQRIAMELGYAIAFGDPIVRQVRNEHDLAVDLQLELSGMKVIDFFLTEIRAYTLKGNSVFELLNSLLENFENTLLDLPRGHFAQSTFKSLHTGYSLWLHLLNPESFS